MGKIPIHILISFYVVEWVILCSVGVEPRFSANFVYFGVDIMLKFFGLKIRYSSVLDCSVDEEYPYIHIVLLFYKF